MNLFYLIFPVIFITSCFNHQNKNYYNSSIQDKDLLINATGTQGNLPIVTWDTYFTDTFKVKDGIQPCSKDFSMIEDCYNEYAPPSPSILRWLSQSSYSQNSNQDYPVLIPQHNDMVNDGRVIAKADNQHNITWKEIDGSTTANKSLPTLFLYKPELKNYDQYSSSPSADGLKHHIHPIVFMNENDSFFQYKEVKNFHLSLCSDNYANDLGQANACQTAKTYNSNQLIKGDCYQQTLIVKLAKDYSNYEIRSVPITIFVPNGKDYNSNEIYIYPRTDSFNLPPLSQVNNMSSWSLNNTLKQMADQCIGSNQPFFCQYIHQQKKMTTITVQKNNPSNTYVTKNAPPYGSTFFEPSITGDGKLMVMNTGSRVSYTYSPVACDITQWNTWHSITKMYTDSNLSGKYDVATYPMRFPSGENIAPGYQLESAYPWIDKKGKNIFLALQNRNRDHIIHQLGGHTIDPHDPIGSSNGNYSQAYIDREPGKMVSVVGAWTFGKVVVLDHGLNKTTFSGRDHYKFNLKLYNEYTDLDPQAPAGKLRLDPAPTRNINSFENLFNYYDSETPIMPFDIVWTVSSGNGKNSEVIFDEYINPKLFINLHMNASTQIFNSPNSGTNRIFPSDGFYPINPDHVGSIGEENPSWPQSAAKRPLFAFDRTPVLQNSATSSTLLGHPFNAPSDIKLMGGARVEPVSMGGVLGSGIYLDGNNDHIMNRFSYQSTHSWLLSIWLDIRKRGISKEPRILYQFGERSFIAINTKTILFYDDVTKQTKNIDISFAGLKTKKYFSLAFKISRINNFTIIKTYINGTKIKPKISFPAYNSFPFQFYNSPFNKNNGIIIGANKLHKLAKGTVLKPFRGWVDEFKMYRLDDSNKNHSFFEEYICNLSYGSLIEVHENDSDTKLADVKNIAVNYDLFENAINNGKKRNNREIEKKAEVCEQLKFETYKNRNDFTEQSGLTLCASTVHKNKSTLAQERCLRNKKLKIDSSPLVADEPRPDFTENQFCLSCHNDTILINGLSLNALTLTPSILRKNDIRRQPLDVPAKNYNCIPNSGPFSWTGDRCSQNPILMDEFFDFNPKISP